MIRAIALDDEPLALGVLENFCQKVSEFTLVKTFTKPKEAEAFLKSNEIEIVFLDIQMPTRTGLDFATILPPDIQVIFTTAFSEYAVEGFHLEAVDYLLKPFSLERFQQAVAKASKQIEYQRISAKLQAQVLQIKADYSLHRINYGDILFFEGLDDYVKIHLHNQKPIVARITLKALTEKLEEGFFIRVHRSFIVPLNRIKSFRNKVISLGDKQIPVGGIYLDLLETQLKSLPANP